MDAYLSKRLPVKPNERVRTLVGNRIMIGSEVARQSGEEPNWVSPEDLSPELKMAPTEYFKRQVYVGCEPFEDPLFEVAVELLGDDNLVLATDTPHWDSALPEESIKPVLKSTRLSEQTKQKVLGGNAATFDAL